VIWMCLEFKEGDEVDSERSGREKELATNREVKRDLPPERELCRCGHSLIGPVAEPMPVVVKLPPFLTDASRR
jgi:hypothetical protein